MFQILILTKFWGDFDYLQAVALFHLKITESRLHWLESSFSPGCFKSLGRNTTARKDWRVALTKEAPCISKEPSAVSVSYTHLTLPTKLEV